MEDRACSTSDRAAPRSYPSVTVSTETAATTADLPIWQLMAADWQVLTMGPDTYGAFVSDGDTVTSTAAFTVGEHGPETVTLPAGAVVWPPMPSTDALNRAVTDTITRMAKAGLLQLPKRPDDPDDGVPALIHR